MFRKKRAAARPGWDDVEIMGREKKWQNRRLGDWMRGSARDIPRGEEVDGGETAANARAPVPIILTAKIYKGG